MLLSWQCLTPEMFMDLDEFQNMNRKGCLDIDHVLRVIRFIFMDLDAEKRKAAELNMNRR